MWGNCYWKNVCITRGYIIQYHIKVLDAQLERQAKGLPGKSYNVHDTCLIYNPKQFEMINPLILLAWHSDIAALLIVDIYARVTLSSNEIKSTLHTLFTDCRRGKVLWYATPQLWWYRPPHYTRCRWTTPCGHTPSLIRCRSINFDYVMCLMFCTGGLSSCYAVFSY